MSLLYAEKTIERSDIQNLYDKIEKTFTEFELIPSKEILVDVSYFKKNILKYEGVPGIRFKDDNIITIYNLGTFEDIGKPRPPLGFDRFILMQLRNDVSESSGQQFIENPELAERFISFFTFLCKETDAIFSVAGPYWQFDPSRYHTYLGDDEVSYFTMILGYDYAPWSTFFLSDSLVNQIGMDLLMEWSTTLLRVDDVGYFIERRELPFLGGIESDQKIWLRKLQIYFDHIFPSLIDAIEKQ